MNDSAEPENRFTFNQVKEMYKSGQIDLVTFMEMQTKTIEYKNLKESDCAKRK